MSERIDAVQFSGFTGLKNTVTPERLSEQDLAVATNVDLDDAGQPRRRRGFTLVAAGDFHSLYTIGATTYAVKDGVLGAVLSDYTFSPLQPGIGSARVAYTTVGDSTYFSTNATGGVITGDTVRAWGKTDVVGTWLSPVVNTTSTLPEVAGALLKDPPRASSLANLNGRIYMAVGSVLWATELYLYDLVDANRNYIMFESDITFVKSVTDGLYVGTEDGVYFLSGSLRKMSRRKVFSTGAVSGSSVMVDPHRIGGDAKGDAVRSKQAVMFLTNTGLCVGLDSGVCFNLTQGAFNFPSAQSAAVMFREQDGISQYVGTMNSSGTPTGNARFGDYVDVEVRRFTG